MVIFLVCIILQIYLKSDSLYFSKINCKFQFHVRKTPRVLNMEIVSPVIDHIEAAPI